MKDFLFSPEQARTPVGTLSGGERARLLLALALANPSNLLVLDEPTNDLDLETLDLLEEMLGDYQGTLIVVSHDRDFLDRIASAIIVAEGNGVWLDYAGGYSDMVAQRGRGVDARATNPSPAPQKPRETQKERDEHASTAKRKLSFNEKRLLETLPERIDALGRDIEKLKADGAKVENFAYNDCVISVYQNLPKSLHPHIYRDNNYEKKKINWCYNFSNNFSFVCIDWLC